MSAPIALSEHPANADRFRPRGQSSRLNSARLDPPRRTRGGTELHVDDPATLALIQRAIERTCPAWLICEREDLVQRAMLRLIRLSRSQLWSFCPGYVYRVAKSVLVDEIRRRRTRAEVPLEEAGAQEPLSATASSPERRAQAGEIERAIRESIEELSGDRRTAVALRLRGLSTADAAHQLGWSRKRTENLVYRGLSELRQKLSERGLDPRA